MLGGNQEKIKAILLCDIKRHKRINRSSVQAMLISLPSQDHIDFA